MSGPFRDFPAIVVYHPNEGNGHPFFNLGVGGFIGGLTGVSSTQLGISEVIIFFLVICLGLLTLTLILTPTLA